MLDITAASWRYAAFYHLGSADLQGAIAIAGLAASRTLLEQLPRPDNARSCERGQSTGLTGICDHCGRTHTWGAVLLDDQGHAITVSQKCAEKLISIPDDAVLQYCQAVVEVRGAAKRRKEIWTRLRQLVSVLRKCPAVGSWLRSSERLAEDLRSRLFRWGWSRKQVKLVTSAAMQHKDTEAGITRFPQVQPAAPAPSGRWQGCLQLLSVKRKVTRYGSQLKGLWLHPTEGWKVWASLPRGFDRGSVGSAANLRITLTPKPGDPTFAWGKRPLALTGAA